MLDLDDAVPGMKSMFFPESSGISDSGHRFSMGGTISEDSRRLGNVSERSVCEKAAKQHGVI